MLWLVSLVMTGPNNAFIDVTSRCCRVFVSVVGCGAEEFQCTDGSCDVTLLSCLFQWWAAAPRSSSVRTALVLPAISCVMASLTVAAAARMNTIVVSRWLCVLG